MLKIIIRSLVVSVLIVVNPIMAIAPELPAKMLENKYETKPINRGESPKIEKRVMRVTAYTKSDKGMNGKGITANGERVQEGLTVAAPKDIPFGAQIFIPELVKTFTVSDRGGAIKGNRLDMYMESRKEAMEFGVKYLEVWIKK